MKMFHNANAGNSQVTEWEKDCELEKAVEKEGNKKGT